jgi:uncharacterized protein YdaU (DUF1376 family)
MSAAPWIKFFASDFLAGTVDLAADEKGAYITILALIWDRGAPIDDDPAWLARRAGMSTRRFNQVRARLIELGKIEARAGLLGNRRALVELAARDAKSRQAQGAAMARWHGEAEPELDLDQGFGAPSFEQNGTALAPTRADESADPERLSREKGEKKRKTTPEQIDLNSRKSEPKAQNSANSGHADASSPSRARATPEPEARIHTNDQDSCARPREDADAEPPSRPLLRDADLAGLVDACSDACGFFPRSPAEIARQFDIVKEWRTSGIDFDRTVIPTILNMVGTSPDPTSSFRRFDRQIRHAHAQLAASARNGHAPALPPQAPLIRFDDEPPEAEPIRRDLLKALGPTSYPRLAHSIRLSIGDGNSPQQRILRVHDRSRVSLFWNDDRPQLITRIAQHHGLADAWKS